AGIHRRASSGRNGTSSGGPSSPSEQYRRKYHDESTNVSSVSGSRSASAPHRGHATRRHASAAGEASGERPRGSRSSPARSGSRTGSSSSGTGTTPQPGQCTTGTGAPQ